MKPLKLTFEAFGPYVEKTTVEFDKLNNGLFLITGDTGAGKTTIFDAMMFALYGKASGSNREVNMLHSDYCPKSKDTVVNFIFEQNGKEYEIERKIHFAKQKNGTYSDKNTGKGILKTEGSVIDKDINTEIENLIGLNVDQFRKIVMLAQGEFQAFLEAKNDKRKDILGKIFDSSDYVRFQSRLTKLRKKLENLDGELVNEIQILINADSLPLPEDMDETDRLLFLPHHPDLVQNIKSLLEKESSSIEELEKIVKSYNTQYLDLVGSKGTAETCNKELEILDGLYTKKTQLDAQKKEMDSLETLFVKMEKAFKYGYPTYQKYNKCSDELSGLKSDLKKKDSEKETEDNNLKDQEKVVENNASKKGEIERISIQLSDLEKSLPKYEDYDGYVLQLNGNNDKIGKYNENIEGYNKKIKAFDEKEEELISEKKEKKEKAENLSFLLTEKNNSENKYKEFFDQEHGILKKIGDLNILKGKVDQAKKDSDKKAAIAKAKSNAYNRIHNAYIEGQAGILAEELKISVCEHGGANCPVCNSYITEDKLIHFPKMSKETPTKEQVDTAKDELEQADKAFSDDNDKYTKLDSKYTENMNSILDQAKKYAFPLLCELDLYNEELISDIKRSLKEENENAYNAWKIADDANKRIGKIDEELELNKQERSKLEESSKQDNDLRQNLLDENIQLQEKINGLKEVLIEDSKEKAEEKIFSLSEKKQKLEQAIKDANQELEKIKDKISTLNGSIDQLKSSIKDKEDQEQECKKAYISSLESNEFDSEKSFLEVLNNIPDLEQGFVYLEGIRNRISTYKNECETNKKSIQTQEEKTKGFVKTDLEELNAKIEGAKILFDSKNSELTNLKKNKEIQEKTLKRLEDIKSKIDQVHNAQKKINVLAEIADPTNNTEGGKYSFESYSLAHAFKEILIAANVRLKYMSGNKYELIHRTTANKANSVAGFDVDVLDIFTNEVRDIKSLSGGETFEVSMALALGLSDVVQKQANGKKIDAMFIDEGFGSLDDDMLMRAKTVLEGIAGDHKQIGIISHVSKLEEVITSKIVVKGSPKGSSLKLEI